jgi:pyrimidine-nucleoside phosphorylase
MLMTDIIAKKRDKQELSTEEIRFFIENYVSGEIPDYQMSALCMAILLNGMNERETLDLTLSMMNSGDILDLSSIEGIKVDKHSTGGVGDKTSLVLCPMVSACGLKVAKMSGRGLGHTGGTIDKLESFPGFNTGISEERFYQNVRDIGIVITGQTANLDPADKLLYALRDVTATVPSIPLITSSIMSKKLASGADIIVLDVKCGDGSFMKTPEDARELAENLIKIGRGAGRKCSAVVSDMSQPLGFAIGNALEVKEAISVLSGNLRNDLLDLCLTIGSRMLVLSGTAENETEAGIMLMNSISSGSALKKLAEMVEAQDGDPKAVYDPSLLPSAPVRLEVKAKSAGYVENIMAEKLGLISMHLGGGRAKKTDVIDLGVGIVLNKKVGDMVSEGDVIATIHANSDEKAETAAEELLGCYSISASPVEAPLFIKEIL